MHILVITQYFWPENFKVNDIVSGLVERGHRVTVLTGLPNYPDGSFFKGYGFCGKYSDSYGGAELIRVPLLPRGKASGVHLALNYLSFVVSACLIAPIRCREHYDLIFVFEPSPITVALPALFLKWLKGVPVLLWVQDLWPDSLAAAGAVSSPYILKLVGKLVTFIYRRCDRILMTSRAFTGVITKYVQDHGQLFYFPQYGEDTYQVVQLPSDAPARSNIPTGFIVMFAGNIGVAQDFESIISAADRLRIHKDIHFVIIGDGRMRSWAEDEVKKFELHETVHFIGRYPLETMADFFSLADTMLVTLKDEPIFSLTIPAKIQSYLACGRPILAALNGEGARIIEEAGAGITCQAEDPVALAHAVLKMRDKPLEERQQMGKNGLNYYNANFDRSMLIDRLEKWMAEVISSSHESSASL